MYEGSAWNSEQHDGARLKEVISKRKYGKNVRALQLPAEFLRE
jgi:hypothetical protein